MSGICCGAQLENQELAWRQEAVDCQTHKDMDNIDVLMTNDTIDPLVEARLLEWDVSEKKRGKVLKGKGHGINNFITLLLVAFTTTWARRPRSN